ncbi:hypothetical protein L21SP5_00127 [Salinivirga cyanobacteriivorans]|uniref:YARHG domain-containing protein n=1 Tax=Salinivirga cyanobacteriivorans TaxID=1307839 RepID=A0A0S2HUT4_9BACT|nr:YARHG domain-containing protein [Salinivirga cyanobacteriivorans]ALO13809.1 hypothetical protein L21SP5_00127 [Salinivirga cyanobacteriivorans]
MKKLFFLLLLLPFFEVFAQTSYDIDDFSFAGYSNNRLIYLNWDDQKHLYTAVLDDSFVIREFKINELENPETIWFIYDSIRLDHSLKSQITTIEINNNKREVLKGYRIGNSIGFAEDENLMVMSCKVAESSILTVYNITEDSLYFLPIIGQKPTIRNGYVYFSAEHICKRYSSYIDDIYRVKIDDWNNPELIIQNADKNWSVLPNSNIIYADILEDKNNRVLFDSETKTYATTSYFGSPTIVKYQGDFYYQMKQFGKPIFLKVIKYDEEYPIADTRNLCPKEKRILVNLPNSQKRFENSFITEDLLYEAPSSELQKLTKGQLRKLRNAFFARQGYQFSSEDLQEFFGQFDWYHEMVERNQFYELSNDQVVISPQDKKRVELIMEVEQGK